MGFAAERVGWERFARIGAFVLGLCAGYVALGSIAGAVVHVGAYSSYAYAALAVWLTVSGIRTIVAASHDRACGVSRAARTGSSIGAAFVAGSAFATLGSFCCSPLGAAVAVGRYGGAGFAETVGLMTAFALGHAAPVVAVASGSRRLACAGRAYFPAWAISTIGGALSLSLASYYALLV
jgi:cytochrome c biogenesis protein CcdA